MKRPRKKAESSPLTSNGTNLVVDANSLSMVGNVAFNVQQELIIVTKDKVELCLTKHMKDMEQRKAWLAPLGVTFSTTIALLTSSFQETFGVKAEMWRSGFVLIAIGSGIYAAYLFFQRKKAKSIHEIICELQLQSPNPIDGATTPPLQSNQK